MPFIQYTTITPFALSRQRLMLLSKSSNIPCVQRTCLCEHVCIANYHTAASSCRAQTQLCLDVHAKTGELCSCGWVLAVITMSVVTEQSVHQGS